MDRVDHTMQPRIETLPEKKLIGLRLTMSLVQNRTAELWRGFMPRRREIRNPLSSDMFSMQVYNSSFDFKDFKPHTVFEKWAAVEVPDFSQVPDGMEAFILQGGLYAVFLYKGKASDFAETFHYIFGNWLPNSLYEVDRRPHFELIGANYKNDDPDSEEDIWIPIREKVVR